MGGYDESDMELKEKETLKHGSVALSNIYHFPCVHFKDVYILLWGSIFLFLFFPRTRFLLPFLWIQPPLLFMSYIQMQSLRRKWKGSSSSSFLLFKVWMLTNILDTLFAYFKIIYFRLLLLKYFESTCAAEFW